jgi:hypothetical protein
MPLGAATQMSQETAACVSREALLCRPPLQAVSQLGYDGLADGGAPAPTAAGRLQPCSYNLAAPRLPAIPDGHRGEISGHLWETCTRSARAECMQVCFVRSACAPPSVKDSPPHLSHVHAVYAIAGVLRAGAADGVHQPIVHGHLLVANAPPGPAPARQPGHHARSSEAGGLARRGMRAAP